MEKVFSKKEKGTQGVPNSGKNQCKYTNPVSNNLLIIADSFHTDLLRRYNYLSDPFLIRENDSLLRDFENLKRIIENDPRLPWHIIQQSIDSLYQQDKNLVGVNIKLIFNDLKEGGISNFKSCIYGISN